MPNASGGHPFDLAAAESPRQVARFLIALISPWVEISRHENAAITEREWRRRTSLLRCAAPEQTCPERRCESIRGGIRAGELFRGNALLYGEMNEVGRIAQLESLH
jgi:hypothetical protein